MSKVYQPNKEWLERAHFDEDSAYLELEYAKAVYPQIPAEAWIERNGDDIPELSILDDFSDFMEEEKARAIALLVEVGPDEINEDGDEYSVGFSGRGPSYLVLTEVEADEKWDECLQSYLDECVLPELPETARMYFDEEKWKEDAKMDGRGHSISSYDGNEEDATDPVSGDTFAVFRMN